MIAVDTNILVYAHREDCQWHEPALARVTGLAEGKASWAIPWPCVHEFLSIATHPKIYDPPTPLRAAIDQVEAWRESPSLVLLSESGDYWRHLQSTALGGKVSGPRVHDSRIAALCLDHGVRELWSADRDFNRFPSLRTVNPLIAPAPSG